MDMEWKYTGWSDILVSRATHGHAFQMGPSHMGFYMALPPSGHCLLPLAYSASQGSAHTQEEAVASGSDSRHSLPLRGPGFGGHILRLLGSHGGGTQRDEMDLE